MKKLMPLLIAFILLTACQQVPAGGSPAAPTPTLPLSGPETTPNAARPYPGSLTLESAAQGIAAVVDAPSEITGLAEVQLIIAKHTQLARAAGLSFDHMAVKYASADQRWFLVPATGDGTIAGWLQIADPTSQSGWRFGEQPTWDSRYHPSTDTYQYGLPALHDSSNHFVVGFENGFPVLIEATPGGAPQYWNDIVQKTTRLVEGALLPTETPVPSKTPIPSPTETLAATQIPFESGSSLEFSPLLPAEWHKEFAGQVAGMDIPIIIGLASDVVHDKVQSPTPITGVWMTQEGTNEVADAFLRAAHYRYTKIMGNDVIYEQYIELLKQPTGGEVNLLILDQDGITRREAMIDPRQGFSMLISGKLDPKYGIAYSLGNHLFFGVDGKGRLLFASDLFEQYGMYGDTRYVGVPVKDEILLRNNFTLLDEFGSIQNHCMLRGNIESSCGRLKAVPEEHDWWQMYANFNQKMIDNNHYEKHFGLVTQ